MTGRCQCGCGRQAPVADHTEQRKGWVKGQPKRFIHGHHMRGRTRQPAIPPGTALDNMQDAAAKGRVRTPGLCGEQHPNSKLTREQVRAIYRSAKSGEHPRELATDFGVSRDTIRFIATRKFWREATDDLV